MNSNILDESIKLVLNLSKELAISKKKGADPNDLWPLHPDREVTDLYRNSKPILLKIIDLVKKENGDQLSDEVILVQILYNVAALRMHYDLSDEEITQSAEKALNNLFHYKATRNVDVPLISLEIDGETFKFGPISFHSIISDDKQSDWWQKVRATLENSSDELFLSYAKVNVPGDLHTSIKNAKELINEGLLILRGISFPIDFKEIHQIGIINEFPVWKNIPYRLDKANENFRVDADSRLVISTGPFRFPYKLYKDLLSKVDQDILTKFLKMIEKDNSSTINEMHNKVLLGFRWLGEATRPDTLSARFAKVAFSLESFIGGEANSKDLSTRGITATLAERAAFLLGNDLDSRKKIDREIRNWYGKRSKIAHGKNQNINPSDFVQFGQLVRKVGLTLIDKNSLFNTVDDLQGWVNDQKYS